MLKDLRNVLLTFGIIILTVVGGRFIYVSTENKDVSEDEDVADVGLYEPLYPTSTPLVSSSSTNTLSTKVSTTTKTASGSTTSKTTTTEKTTPVTVATTTEISTTSSPNTSNEEPVTKKPKSRRTRAS